MPHDDLEIRPITPDDAGEVLTLQRAAFVQEAIIYGTPHMPPLTQTLEEISAELVENLGCVALRGPRIVGAVRARQDRAARRDLNAGYVRVTNMSGQCCLDGYATPVE